MKHIIDKKKKHIYSKTSLNELYADFLSEIKNPRLKTPTSKKLFKEASSDKHWLWRGGFLSELESAFEGQRDISGVIKAKNTMGSISRDLNTGLRFLPKRRRVLSEFDGDWDFDRRWDMSPFSGAQKQGSAARSLNLIIEFSAGAGTSPKQLDTYGAFIVALIETIEASGITVELTMRLDMMDLSRNGLSSTLDILLKKHGEYLSTQTLASSFWSNFFRRVGFFALMAQSEAYGHEPSSGLGYTRFKAGQIYSDKGELRISPISFNIPKAEDLIKGVKEALA